MADLPTVVTSAGLQPQTPTSLRAQLLAIVAATQPGYTANLPGSLIEDISSTDVGAIVLCDQARVETVNSLTPYGANAFTLNQLGNIYGVTPGEATNTSVYVVFSGPPGFVVAQGFVVSDGTYQYIVQDGGIIGSDGTSPQLFAVASIAGSWAVTANSVSQIVTSVPSGITLTVNNPAPGTPGTDAETEESFRARVLEAGLAAAQGMPSFLRTILGQVSGVQTRLIATLQLSGGWRILVGGGDPYEVANAIYTALFDISSLVGSALAITDVSNANPAIVTTNLNHNFTTGQSVTIANVGGAVWANAAWTATVVSPTTFSIPVDSTSLPAYTSGGIFVPNPRDENVTISDYPDVYNVVFVNPPQQSVAVTLAWNTIEDNFTQGAAVAQLGSPALVDYINSIPVGQPINLFELQSVFQLAIASVLSPQQLTRMVFSVSINGVGVSPEVGTGIIAGDPESYFLTDSTQVTITQG